MLEVRNLSVWYGVTEVLRDVSFAVPAGSIIGLLGGNGAGKTTLLNALSGLLRPRGGAIEFEGRPIQGLSPHEIVRHGVAQVPQGRFVWPHMTVRDNIELGAVTRRDRAAIRRDLEEMYGLFPALQERRASKAGALSAVSSLASEVRREGIRVHAVNPDGVNTELLRSMEPGGQGQALVRSGMLVTPEQVATGLVGMFGTGRVYRTIPAWRGAILRLTGLAPGPVLRMEPAMRAIGARKARSLRAPD